MRQRQPIRTLVIGLATMAFFICSVLPVAQLLVTACSDVSGTDAAALLLDIRQRGLLYNTAALGVGTAVVATALGVPLGVALARVRLRRKALVRMLLAAPALLPPYVVGLTWV